jgi:cytoskeletal protein CcmA (bactofilin family)
VFNKRNKPGPPPAASPDATLGPDGSPARFDSAGNPARPGDSGLGVPPFRPAAMKEALNMSRPPFPAPSPTSQQPLSGSASAPLPGTPAPRPGGAPGGRVPGREPAERRTLVVGRGISLQGVVQDAERLVVEGTIEATMIHATELAIAPGGVFKGEVEVEDAEVAGTIDGTLTARGNLIVRATGRVLGTARCRRLQVEDGGQITGRMEMITDTLPRAVEPRPEAATS